ncbi:carbon storage regulator, CsrA [Microterricola viridarii]|uniref:Translational regulator CsrA n=1 Tax=Microterricola viridarii TaxID=412690 RepID=A0A1H1W0S8_9MICO|nr:carbon storage regulator CsrA [Microterricola viridarii]SDS90868.1 carbon storage regulator, CsrA [Microterricola viridarii]
MLVLTRKPGEKILIGDDIVITVLDARGDSIRIGVDAPRGIKIQRSEVVQAVAEANAEATGAAGSAEEQRLVLSLGKLAPPVPTAQPVPDPAAATE